MLRVFFYGCVLAGVLLGAVPHTTAVEAQDETVVRLLFGGDMMFDRGIRVAAQTEGYDYIFADLAPVVAYYDLVIANLEGPVTDFNPSTFDHNGIIAHSYTFTFEPELLPVLKAYVDVVNIGNNHTRNMGSTGLEQTKTYLDANGIEYFGDLGGDDSTSLIKDLDGVKIGLVNYNQFVYRGLERTLETIRTVRPQVDVLIVYAHWGEEYQLIAPGYVVAMAHQFVDAGADSVIGTHPHVVQNTELYRGKKIYYSLGNLIFDQYFSYHTMNGLLVGIKIAPDLSLDYTEIEVKMRENGRSGFKSERECTDCLP